MNASLLFNYGVGIRVNVGPRYFLAPYPRSQIGIIAGKRPRPLDN